MFKVFILLLSINGQTGVAESVKEFDTREACQAVELQFVSIVEADLRRKGLDSQISVAASRCATEEEFSSEKS